MESGIIENNIYLLRAERKLTQQDLANLVGVSRQTIISIEKGNYNPSLLLGFQIAKALGTSIDKVFHYK